MSNEEELEREIDLKIKEWHDSYLVDWWFMSLLLREQADFCYMKHSSKKYLSGKRGKGE